MVKLVAKIILLLNSNSSGNQIAAGMASGLLLALLPAGNLLWLLLFFLFFCTKAHYGMLVLSLALFKSVAPLAWSGLDWIGWSILTMPALEGMFTALYNAPIAPLTRFNDSIVMGGLAAGSILWLYPVADIF